MIGTKEKFNKAKYDKEIKRLQAGNYDLDVMVTSAMHDGSIGLVKECERGYYKTDWNFDTYKDAKEFADNKNRLMGYSIELELAVIFWSMRKQGTKW